jgi:hypothetical protein
MKEPPSPPVQPDDPAVPGEVPEAWLLGSGAVAAVVAGSCGQGLCAAVCAQHGVDSPTAATARIREARMASGSSRLSSWSNVAKRGGFPGVSDHPDPCRTRLRMADEPGG